MDREQTKETWERVCKALQGAPGALNPARPLSANLFAPRPPRLWL